MPATVARTAVGGALQRGPALPSSRRPTRAAALCRNRSRQTPHSPRATAEAQVVKPVRPSQESRDVAFGKVPEQREEVALEVKGEIPQWLTGTYMRNGPGDYTGMNHMFDGYAQLAKVRVEGGKAYGMAKFIQSLAFRNFRDTGSMRWREFATGVTHSGPVTVVRDLVETVLGATGMRIGMTDNASVNVVPHPTPGRVMALTESALGAYEVDLTTLETIRRVEWPDAIPGMLTTAHPHPTVGGDVINLMSEIGGGYHVYRQAKGTMAREEVAYIPHLDPSAPAWLHDFAVTENYAVVVESPLYFNLVSLVTGQDTDHIFMDWKPEKRTRVHIVSLTTGEVTTKMAPAFWAFHFTNAFESADGSELYVDMAKFRNPDVLNQLKLSALRDFNAPDLDDSHPERMTIRLGPGSGDIAAGDIRRLCPEAEYGNYFEFPTINYQYHSRPYRYSYGIAAVRPTNIANALVKHDQEQGSSKVWIDEGAGCMTGEPKFVPRPGATEEDDGVVVAMCTASDATAYCVFLDGQTFTELARAEMPYGLGYGFHGNFFAHA